MKRLVTDIARFFSISRAEVMQNWLTDWEYRELVREASEAYYNQVHLYQIQESRAGGNHKAGPPMKPDELAETRGRLERVRLHLSTMHAGNWATVLAETLALALASPTPREPAPAPEESRHGFNPCPHGNRYEDCCWAGRAPAPSVSRPLDAVERVLAVECPRHGKDPCQGSSSHDADPWFCASRIRRALTPPEPTR